MKPGSEAELAYQGKDPCRNETALHPYSHSQPLRAHSSIVLKINIFHVEKGRSPRKRGSR